MTHSDRLVFRAKHAVAATFIVNGFAYASWASRIPQIKDELHVSPGTLGLVLLCNAIGSLVSMPITGAVVQRIGDARTIAIMAWIAALGLGGVALGYRMSALTAGLAFVAVGFGNGAWDVSMNVQAAEVERRLGRSILSRFHAGFSIGTVAGAMSGAALVALHVSVTTHIAIVAAFVAITMPLVVRGFLPRVRATEAREEPRPAWREPRTLLIGVFVLCMAFTEGTGNDWLGIAAVDAYHMPFSVGALTLACFLVAMTTGRWFGPAFLDRYGRVKVLRACCVMALAGLGLVIFGRLYPVALVGVVLWGLGASLGFPTGVSAAADDPARSATRVSVVSTVAYLAFLAGPPLVGFVGNQAGVLHSLGLAAALLALAIAISGVLRPI